MKLALHILLLSASFVPTPAHAGDIEAKSRTYTHSCGYFSNRFPSLKSYTKIKIWLGARKLKRSSDTKVIRLNRETAPVFPLNGLKSKLKQSLPQVPTPGLLST